MTCVSLFSGIGGIDIAAHAAGFRTACFVERDRFCRAVLAHHWPGVPQFDDVVTFGDRHAAEFVGADLLHGGFPCQDISAAGLGAGLSGARSGLWFAMLDCIGAVRPRFVLAENVGALRSRGIDTVLGGLESAGYAANALVVAADDMGAPHRRERVFIVGELADAHRLRQLQPGWRVADLRQRACNHSQAGGYGGRRAASRLDRGADGLPRGLDGCTRPTWPARPGEAQHAWEPPRLTTKGGRGTNRAARLKALGNAVVPAQVYPILAAMAGRLREEATR